MGRTNLRMENRWGEQVWLISGLQRVNSHLPIGQWTAPAEYWIRNVDPQAHNAPAEPEAAV